MQLVAVLRAEAYIHIFCSCEWEQNLNVHAFCEQNFEKHARHDHVPDDMQILFFSDFQKLLERSFSTVQKSLKSVH